MKRVLALLALAALAALLIAGGLNAALSSLSGPSWAELERERLAVERAAAVAPVETFAAQALALAPVVVVYGLILLAGAWGSLALTRFLRERRPDGRGLLPLPAGHLGDAGGAALAAYHLAHVEQARRPLTPHTYSPHLAYHHRADGGGALVAPADEPAAQLPGMIDLAALGHRPTAASILLALGEGGERITVPARALCHVALVGATGGGKSNLLRLLLPQLIACGGRVVLADPHYAPIDPDSGDDWRPIARRLHMPPAVSTGAGGEIDQLLGYLLAELDRRLELRHAGERWGPPLFLALDELPVIAEDVPRSVDRLARLLREGRKVGLYSVGAAQTFLVKVIGGDSAARENFRTAFYVGGDLRSAAALLDVRQAEIDEGVLGAGVAYLRSVATSPARLVRVPLASNAAVAGLLGDGAEDLVDFGRATGQASAGPEAGPEQRVIPFPGPAAARVWPGSDESRASASGRGAAPLDAETARILAALAAGRGVRQVAAELSGSDNPSDRRHKAAREQIERIMAELARGQLNETAG